MVETVDWHFWLVRLMWLADGAGPYFLKNNQLFFCEESFKGILCVLSHGVTRLTGVAAAIERPMV